MRRRTVMYITVTAAALAVVLLMQGGCTDYKGQLEQANAELAKAMEMISLKNNEVSELRQENTDMEQKLEVVNRLYQEEKAKGKCPPELRHFNSVGELRKFLEEDNTDSIKYERYKFDCDDFAIRLINNAAKKGYILLVHWDFNMKHVNCVALVYNLHYYKVYLIEPENDNFSYTGIFDIGGK